MNRLAPVFTRRAPVFRHVARLCLTFALLLAGANAAAEAVQFAAPDGTQLTAHWLPAPGQSGARPTVVALHGCGGLYLRDGVTLAPRFTQYAQRLHRAGYHVLLPDSFGSRGLGSICATRNAERRIKVQTRRNDVAAALDWLAARPEVDARRIALLAWSNGASTALAAIDAARPDFGPPLSSLAGAVLFYPGCRAALAHPFVLAVPTLMLLGADDDWTPAAYCEQLAARLRTEQPGVDLTARVYPASHHGFDGAAPVRLRTDVPNGASPAGVHVGGNPEAGMAARNEMDLFLARILP